MIATSPWEVWTTVMTPVAMINIYVLLLYEHPKLIITLTYDATAILHRVTTSYLYI